MRTTLRPMSATLRVLLLAMALPAGACSSQPGKAPPATGAGNSAAEEDIRGPFERLGYRLDWTGFPHVSRREKLERVQPYGDAVAALDSGSTLTILEGRSGRQRCAVQVANRLANFLDIEREGNTLFVSSESDVYEVDVSTCNLTDRQEIDKVAASGPVRVGDTLFFGGALGEVVAHKTLATVGGVKIWGFKCDGTIQADPVLVGDAIATVTQKGDVVVLDLAGNLRGRARISGGMVTNPVAGEGAFYAASLDQSIYAFTVDGAALMWRYRTSVPLREQPAYFDGAVYCSVEGEGLVALDARTGAVRWRAQEVYGTPVTVRQGYLLVWTGSEFAVLDRGRGDVIDRVPLPEVDFVTVDAFEDGVLYTANKDGGVSKYLPLN